VRRLEAFAHAIHPAQQSVARPRLRLLQLQQQVTEQVALRRRRVRAVASVELPSL
jgi:hypothetical protein